MGSSLAGSGKTQTRISMQGRLMATLTEGPLMLTAVSHKKGEVTVPELMSSDTLVQEMKKMVIFGLRRRDHSMDKNNNKFTEKRHVKDHSSCLFGGEKV